MKWLWFIPVIIVLRGMLREWRRLNPVTSQDVLKSKRKEMQNRNKRRQEWEWRRAV